MAIPRLTNERIALWRQVDLAFAHVRRRVDEALVAECDLSLAFYDVLTVLRERGEMRVGGLCSELGEISSSLSRRLDRMEDEGLVVRAVPNGSTDRRAVTVSITKAGRDLWRDSSTVYRRVLQAELGRHLTDTDAASLARFTAKLANQPE